MEEGGRDRAGEVAEVHEIEPVEVPDLGNGGRDGASEYGLGVAGSAVDGEGGDAVVLAAFDARPSATVSAGLPRGEHAGGVGGDGRLEAEKALLVVGVACCRRTREEGDGKQESKEGGDVHRSKVVNGIRWSD